MKLFQDKRKLAIGIVHYVYRNTNIVEDSHSKCIIMDQAFYSKVYRTVKRKIKTVIDFKDPLSAIEDHMSTEQILRIIPKEQKMRFCKYMQEICFYSAVFGTNWDEPIIIDNIIENHPANFILRGNFLECCQNHVCMNDQAMCLMNKDIYNRVYTLILNGYL